MSKAQTPPIDVLHLQRRPIPGFHSVERLFEDLRERLRDTDIHVQVRINDSLSTGLLPRLRDAWAARKAQRQVNHVTGDVHYLAWFLDPARTILTVLDCVGLSRLKGWRRQIFKFFWYTLPVARSHYITVISEFTKRELLAETSCDPSRIRVIYPHLSDEFEPAPKGFADTRPRILQIGTAPNKNIESLARALAGLNVHLVVVGHLSASQSTALNQANLSFEEKVGLTRGQIREEYRQADIVAFVSTYEGFGLPIIEAQAIGRAVVTSNTCSMPEVAADAACLVDPNDPGSIRAGFQRVISEPEYRESLISRGLENVNRFRLQKIAQDYAQLYRDVALASSGTGGLR